MDLKRLYDILDETTYQLRKGGVVENKNVGNVNVTEVYLMPNESEVPNNIEKVDIHFIVIGVDKPQAELYKNELITILKDWPSESWGVKLPKLEDGPSYIHVGGVLGDQGKALQLFALGKVLALWEIITPETLGFKGEDANSMAGNGFIMISGYKNS